MRTAAVDHDRRMVSRTRPCDRVCRCAYVLGGIVRALCAAAQDNVHVLVPARLDDGGDALFRDAHKRVRVATRAHGVHRDRHAAVRAVLEADREGYARGKFAVELGFGGARADSAPRNEVIEVLRGNSIEKLRADWNAEVGEVTEELAGEAKPSVDLKRTVYSGIVDEAFPADCRAGFLDEERQVRCVRKGFGVSDEVSYLTGGHIQPSQK